MSLTHEIQVEFTQRSARIKSLDLHPVKPWILVAQHSGMVEIWNYKLHRLEKSFVVTDNNLPVRSAKFIAQKEWIVIGSDDKMIRVYDYNNEEKIKEFKGHEDYIRNIVVHPNQSYILSSSDDHLIKLWDWENDWSCVRTFEGHSHYVMQLAINPIHDNMFASVSLDGSFKIWNLQDSNPIASMVAHEKGVNCVNYLTRENKLYLLTGSDDYTTKIWDSESLSCVTVLEGHTNNVNAILTHPDHPLIFTASEDKTIRIWDAVTYQLVKTLDEGLGRVWAIQIEKNSNQIMIGCDEGYLVGKIIIG
ncbi:coatomer subunit beta'-1-like [Silene latifolia]|uniref:coatomer subunit beta'-1-like n=1 Tax=Silene latifolia TaxID=37657 RepID=UPI003D76B412